MSISLGGANGLAYLALRDLGCLRPGQLFSTDMGNDILLAANQMLDAWQVERLLVPWQTIFQFTLTALKQVYTIGPNETAPRTLNGVTTVPIQGVRPLKLEYVDVLINQPVTAAVVRQPVEILEDDKDWERIRIQAIPAAIPLKIYFDKSATMDGSTGLYGVFYLWPGPQASYQMEFLEWQPLQQFAALGTSYLFPPAYQRLIQKGLAIEIAPLARMYAKIHMPGGGEIRDYDPKMLALVEKQYRQAKQTVELHNAAAYRALTDPAFMGGNGRRGGYNYGTGDVGRTA